MALLRRVIGDALRARRQSQHRTLREISTAANVSLGYLSEIERGQKEASSELLAAICEALGFQLSEILSEASELLAKAERVEPTRADAAEVVPASPSPAPRPLAPAGAKDRPVQIITDGPVSVSVRRHGPFRTTLQAVRTKRPGQPVARTG